MVDARHADEEGVPREADGVVVSAVVTLAPWQPPGTCGYASWARTWTFDEPGHEPGNERSLAAAVSMVRDERAPTIAPKRWRWTAFAPFECRWSEEHGEGSDAGSMEEAMRLADAWIVERFGPAIARAARPMRPRGAALAGEDAQAHAALVRGPTGDLEDVVVGARVSLLNVAWPGGKISFDDLAHGTVKDLSVARDGMLLSVVVDLDTSDAFSISCAFGGKLFSDAFEECRIQVEDPPIAMCAENFVGLVDRARREGFAVWSAGTVGDDGDGPDVHVYADQLCSRCGHVPCPCCGTFCDDGDCVGDGEDGSCVDVGCSYEAEPRFFNADGSAWP